MGKRSKPESCVSADEVSFVDELRTCVQHWAILKAVVDDGRPIQRSHVTALEVLFLRFELIESTIDERQLSGETIATAEKVLQELEDDLPVWFHVFCRRLSVDARISFTESPSDPGSEQLNDIADRDPEVWWRLQAAAMDAESRGTSDPDETDGLNPKRRAMIPESAASERNKAFLKTSDPESAAYRDGDQWCDSRYARTLGISEKHINRARQERGLYGTILTDRRKADEPGKPFVYRRAELNELSDRIPDEYKVSPDLTGDSVGNPHRKSP